MLTRALIASAALMATTVSAQVGSAVVINKCSYEVYVCNTPAADGGYEEYSTWLGQDSNNNTYTQQFTQLSNDDGWSIKLSQSDDDLSSNIMQYEYTYQGNDIIWYDLSDVNGNPWNGNWEITASSEDGECDPKQQAYRYSTDDAYGMQACPSDSVITVTLCSGDSSDDSGAASASSSAAAESSTAATATSTFTTPATPTAFTFVATSASDESSSSAETSSSVAVVAAVETSSSAAVETSSSAAVSSTPSTTVQSTTFATSTSSTVITPYPGVTITEIDTAVVTDVVTATYWQHAGKRHEHHHRRHGGNNA